MIDVGIFAGFVIVMAAMGWQIDVAHERIRKLEEQARLEKATMLQGQKDLENKARVAMEKIDRLQRDRKIFT